MRIFEVLILVILFSSLVVRMWRVEKRPSWTSILPAAAILLSLVHFIIAGHRWQIAPTYALAILLLLLSIPQILGKSTDSPIGRGRRMLNRIGLAVGLGWFALAAALPVWFPPIEMPEPTGPYAVGTTSFAFTDKSRPEIFTENPTDKRLVYMQAWYPAESIPEAKPAPMWIYPEELIVLLTKFFLMPEVAFSHLPSVLSHSYVNAPLPEQETTYPILVFSHGYDAGFFAQNMVQMEELASHGYVIFSIGHAYESSLVFDEQGQAIPMSEAQIYAFSQEDDEAIEAKLKIFAVTGDEQIQAARDWMAAIPLAQQSTQIWTEDTQFVLTQIEQMNSGQVVSPFAGHLDTSRIGVFGQSFGGSAAFQVCAVDSRCKAAINMDGTQWGNLLDDPLQTPFMMMSGEDSIRVNDWTLSNAQENGYNVYVRDAWHINFTDFNLVSPLFKFPLWGAMGSIDTRQMERIMNAYVLAFFDQTLKGIPSPLLQGDSPEFPEVELTVFEAHTQGVNK
jgi:predicted dienelactone hydrolase